MSPAVRPPVKASEIAPKRLQSGERGQRSGFGTEHAWPQAYRRKPCSKCILFLLGGKAALRAGEQQNSSRGALEVTQPGLRTWGEQQAELTGGLARQLASPDLDRAQWLDCRNAVAPALFARGHNNSPPMCEPFYGTLGIQPYDAPIRGKRLDRRHAELDCFLQGKVHTLPARHALRKCDHERCLSRSGLAFTYLDHEAIGRCLGDSRPVLVAIAVEENQFFARLQPQHARGVMSLGPRQQAAAPGLQLT